MRQDAASSFLTARFRSPRHVVAIMFETGSVYFTSHKGMTDVPGNVIYGCLEDIASTSAELNPDEGRATVGSLSFSVVDVQGDVTDEIREQLLDFERGVRGKEVRVWTGDSDDFNDLVRVETYVIDDAVEVTEHTYRFQCSDRNREMREDIFVQVGTRMTSTLELDHAEVFVQSTQGFEMLQHTASFQDAPSQTVGYIRVRKSKEIIRYTDKTPTAFIGCTRECFNTIAERIVVEPETEEDRQPEVEEFIYLEMPGPQLLYALQTGRILDTTITLPETWHLGIDESTSISEVMYQQIGTDLYDPSDFTKGFMLRFTHLQKTEGKRFCEEQLHVPMGTFAPIDAFGRLGLRRMSALVSTAVPVAVIDHSNIVDFGRITHSQRDVINEVVVDWNYDGEEYTRTAVMFNSTSLVTFGRGASRSYDFAGLHVSRHGSTVLDRIFNTLADRYGAPPILCEVNVLSSMNALEIGDIVQLVLPNVRDYTALSTLNRAFEVQSISRNWVTGEMSLQLFGSAARTVPDALTAGTPISDAWYTSEGTDLATVLTIVGDHVTTSGVIVGDPDLRVAVYYYDGDLTIDVGVVITITDNVQLRIRGFLTNNGEIDGAGNGPAAMADPYTVGNPITILDYTEGHAATFGTTRGGGGVHYSPPYWNGGIQWQITGAQQAIGRLALEVRDGALLGIPAELRGTRGEFGGPTSRRFPPAIEHIVQQNGGAGGAGGAGLFIVCRGLTMGLNGEIDLSGEDGSPPPAPFTLVGRQVYSGAGGGGAPGMLYVVLDGDTIPYPDLDGGSFIANHGDTPSLGNPIQNVLDPSQTPDPLASQNPGIGVSDNWEAAHFIHYAPRDSALGESDDEAVPAPQDFTADGDASGVLLEWIPPPPERYQYVDIYESIDNDRQNSVRIARVRGDSFFKSSSTSVTRWYWIQAVYTGRGRSFYVPLSQTGGVEATFGGASNAHPPWTPLLTGNMTRTDATFEKTGANNDDWDAAFYSQEGYPACFVSFRVGVPTDIYMIGLSSDPATNHSFNTIDHALYVSGNEGGLIHIYEDGVDVGTFGTWDSADQGMISYDGLAVRYWRNGFLLRTVPRVGAFLYADSSFFRIGSAAQGVQFGPQNHVLANATGWAADALGLPAGVRAVEGIEDRSQISLFSGHVHIASTPVATVGYGIRAIPINDGREYQVTIKHASSLDSVDGVFLRANESALDELPQGITHVGNPAAGAEAVVITRDSFVDLISNGPMPGGTSIIETFTYNPSAGAKYVSLSFYNWDAATAGVVYGIEWVALTEIGSNVDLLPGVIPPIDTYGLNQDAVDEVIHVEDVTGVNAFSGGLPVEVDEFAPAGVFEVVEDIEHLEITAAFESEILQVTGGLGEIPDVNYLYTVMAYREYPAGAFVEIGQPLAKTDIDPEPVTGTGSVTGLAPGFYEIGVLARASCNINGGAGASITAANITMVAMRIRR